MKYLQNTPAHEPPMQAIDNQHQHFFPVQGRIARFESGSSHLDPLPSSDEGRGNPAVCVNRIPVCVCERSARFPLPFGRGEDQGEGWLWKTFVSLTKWKWSRGEGEGRARVPRGHK